MSGFAVSRAEYSHGDKEIREGSHCSRRGSSLRLSEPTDHAETPDCLIIWTVSKSRVCTPICHVNTYQYTPFWTRLTVCEEAGEYVNMATSTADTKRAVEETWIEAMSGNVDALDELFAEDAVYHEPGAELHGREDIKAHMKEWQEAFPDFEFEVKDAVAEDDVVMTYFVATGTHDGSMRGIPATGNTFEGEGVQIDRFEDGEVIEEINIWDNLTFFEQLGIDPAEL